ncbi:MAG: PEP-CTERM sorting domain-containing protein [Desulfarculaceae bacterium]|nr:PEP-CTERM sorting domain-containing protein [Desulfarculaceae bacterium]MCF8073911.1 PEP-CTERM sorting domain-containing protein [Desulfarculaceae bacterium]MCF8102064.1 PEP-CTERM sorting domain-containing protein [Desulfarculaceae bacterium]MCF8116335.1 PEP-CTERM sorting domain-containing protein [Desulfarculaceae bacterium]
MGLLHKAIRPLLAALLVALVLAPLGASASSFTFGGDNSFKVQSKGKVNPYQSGVTGSSSGTGDLVTDYYVGLYGFNLFDAIGTSDVSVGDSFAGLNYSISDQRSVKDPNFYVTSDYFRKQGPDKRHIPDSYEMAGSLVLDSVTFDSPYEITLKGYLTDLSFNDSTGSAILQDLRGSETVDFLLTVSYASKTSGEFIPVLQSKHKSTWASMSGSISGGGSPAAAPEPGTLLLVASSLGGLAAWRRRKKIVSARA